MKLYLVRCCINQDAYSVWVDRRWQYISGLEIVQYGLKNYAQMRDYIKRRTNPNA